MLYLIPRKCKINKIQKKIIKKIRDRLKINKLFLFITSNPFYLF